MYNPSIAAPGIDYVNDTAVIRTNPKVTAINNVIEGDITSQVCSDSIVYHYSGVVGPIDFMHGAALSEGGKPIIALPSTTSKGETDLKSCKSTNPDLNHFSGCDKSAMSLR